MGFLQLAAKAFKPVLRARKTGSRGVKSRKPITLTCGRKGPPCRGWESNFGGGVLNRRMSSPVCAHLAGLRGQDAKEELLCSRKQPTGPQLRESCPLLHLHPREPKASLREDITQIHTQTLGLPLRRHPSVCDNHLPTIVKPTKSPAFRTGVGVFSTV